MDLHLFFGVLARHKTLLLRGLVLAAVLAALTYGTPSLSRGPHLVPRGQETWQSQSQVLITFPGFPYGRTQVAPPATSKASSSSTAPASPGFQTNLASLGIVFANLANGDALQSQLRSGSPRDATVRAQPVYDPNSGLPQPFVDLIATGPTGRSAAALAARAATNLQAYIARQQSLAYIPADERIELELIQTASKPQLTQGHKITLAVLVFLAVLTAVVSLAFLLENGSRSQAAGRQAVVSATNGVNGSHGETPPDDYARAILAVGGKVPAGSPGAVAPKRRIP